MDKAKDHKTGKIITVEHKFSNKYKPILKIDSKFYIK